MAPLRQNLPLAVAIVFSSAVGCALPSTLVTASKAVSEAGRPGHLAAKVGTAVDEVNAPSSRPPVVARAQAPVDHVVLPFGIAPSAWVVGNVMPVAVSQPTFGTPTYDPNAAPYTNPYSNSVQDPFAAPGAAPLFPRTPPTWHAYTSALAKVGNKQVSGIGDVVIPLDQDGQSLLFADLRGRFDDSNNTEGNFGLGYRSIVDPFWIVGVNGFYDLIHTDQGGSFQQVGVGIEAMSVLLEARANGYVPLDDSELLPGPLTAEAIGNSIFLVGNEQRAYYGADAEVGLLLYDGYDGQTELRGFIGGYWFDTNKDGFPTIAGPKGRLELRSYDLPMLGPDSRLMFGVEMQWDDVNDFQVAGLARVVIPLGYDHSRRLSRLERRMLDRIVRDDAIVTHVARTPRELGIDSDTGRLLNNVLVVDAETDDVPAGVDPMNLTVIADGSKGTINTDATIFVPDGVVFRGGGFTVIGEKTGATATFGTRPTINGTDTTADVVSIANNTIVLGIDITGGARGISNNDGGGNFADLTNIAIRNNTVTGAQLGGYVLGSLDANSVVNGNTADGNFGDGFTILGDVAGDVSDNTATNNAGSGFRLAGNAVALGELTGTMAGNTASGNGVDGMAVFNVAGSLSNNTVIGNGGEGIAVFNDVTGSISNNTATDNARGGITVFHHVAGTISNNTASSNGLEGIAVFHDVSGQIVNNTTANNGLDGIAVFNNVSGSIANNTATSNFANGLLVGGDVSGDVTGNTTTGNGASGINVGTVSGSVTGNTSTSNGNSGIFVVGDVSGSVANNVANGNLANGIDVGSVSGIVQENTADGNGGDGIFVFSDVTGALVLNEAAGNFGNGFFIGGNSNGFVAGNAAEGNGADGFFVQNFTGGTLFANVASENSGNGFAVDTWSGGGLLFNSATNNGGAGYLINNRTNPPPITLSIGNTASGNADDTVPFP